MHLSIILVAIAVAVVLRLIWQPSMGCWVSRWQQTLSFFLIPPLLLLMTAVSVLCMGAQGMMMGFPVGQVGYLLSVACLGCAGLLLLSLVGQGWRSLQKIRTYDLTSFDLTNLGEVSGRILETPMLFAAQVGFWQPDLVVSRGLLQTLNPEQLQAVLAHEQAHLHYRDTFWFFWLGWLRHLTAWLPYTEALWQELLLLRELRADRRAAQQVDVLLLAETLLAIVRSPLSCSESSSLTIAAVTSSRFEERIEALIGGSEQGETGQIEEPQNFLWLYLSIIFLPLVTVMLHV